MVPYARRLCTWTGLALLVGTEGFVRPPSCSPLATKKVERSASSSLTLASRKAFSSTTMRRKRLGRNAAAASWVSCGSDRRRVGALFSAQQSVDGGVALPPAEAADEYAPFLSESICQHLDEEWLPQECHKSIGEEVARLYRATAQQNGADMTTLVLDVGTKMETFDMGDAFVGPWDIANLVSDFMMEKMGAETSGCSTKAPTASSSATPASSSSTKDTESDITESDNTESDIAVAATTAHGSTFRLTADMARQMQTDLSSDFARYRFLVDFMQGEASWDEVNTVMAVYQGHRAEDEPATGGAATGGEGGGEAGALPGVRRGWARAFPGRLPPDLKTAEGLVEALEADFPEDPDMLEGLEVIVEQVYGGEAKRMDAGDAEKGIAPNPVYLRRATVVKWLYLVGFLQDDIKRVPDDPVQLAELISGRARLKNPTS